MIHEYLSSNDYHYYKEHAFVKSAVVLMVICIGKNRNVYEIQNLINIVFSKFIALGTYFLCSFLVKENCKRL